MTVRDSQSVDGEEVNMPSSDTEIVGGVSDVSIEASSSSVVLGRNLWWTLLWALRCVRQFVGWMDGHPDYVRAQFASLRHTTS